VRRVSLQLYPVFLRLEGRVGDKQGIYWSLVMKAVQRMYSSRCFPRLLPACVTVGGSLTRSAYSSVKQCATSA